MELHKWLNCNVVSPTGDVYKLRFINLIGDKDGEVTVLTPRNTQPNMKLLDMKHWEVIDVNLIQWIEQQMQTCEDYERDAFNRVLKHIGVSQMRKIKKNGNNRT